MLTFVKYTNIYPTLKPFVLFYLFGYNINDFYYLHTVFYPYNNNYESIEIQETFLLPQRK